MIFLPQIESLIRQTLSEIKGVKLIYKSSDAPVKLLLGTMAQESEFGKYIRQLGNGPALGVFQMEPATFNDIVDNYLSYKPELIKEIKQVCNVSRFNASDLESNLKLAIIFARLQYYRRPEPLPKDLLGMANYWKKYYNTYHGKGTIGQFMTNYEIYVKD